MNSIFFLGICSIFITLYRWYHIKALHTKYTSLSIVTRISSLTESELILVTKWISRNHPLLSSDISSPILALISLRASQIARKKRGLDA